MDSLTSIRSGVKTNENFKTTGERKQVSHSNSPSKPA